MYRRDIYGLTAIYLSILAQASAGLELCLYTFPNGENSLSICGQPPFHVTTAAVAGERLLEPPDSPLVIALWIELSGPGATTPFYAISRDGVTFPDVRPTSYDLKLKYAQFDPTVESLAIDPALEADSANRLYIVQFLTHSLPEYRAALVPLGVELLASSRNHAHLVNLDPSSIPQLLALPYVRAVTPYHPAFRLEPYLRENLAEAQQLFPWQTYNIMLAKPGLAQKTAVSNVIAAVGGVVEALVPKGAFMEATLNPDQLLAAVRMNQVIWIDRAGPLVMLTDGARVVSGANYVGNTFVPGYTGVGVRGEVADDAVLETHDAFAAKPPIIHAGNSVIYYDPQDPDRLINNHGTPVYGILFGDGKGAPLDAQHPGVPRARGVIPGAQGIFSSVYTMGNQYCHVCEQVSGDCGEACGCGGEGQVDCDPDAPYQTVFQSNSWGRGALTTAYTARSANYDDFVMQYDLLMCQAQGNCGACGSNGCTEDSNGRCSVQDALAKNVVSVGGVIHHNALKYDAVHHWIGEFHIGDFPDPIISGASIGPTSDGRIKPDLAHFYDWMTTIYPSSNTAYLPNASFPEGFNGTSAATPIACGHFGLFFEMWSKGIFGNAFNPNASVFENRPHAATAKAMMINTARQYPLPLPNPNPAPGEPDITRYVQGWGRADVRKLYNLALRNAYLLIVNETDVVDFTQTPGYAYTITVPPGAAALKITLVWTDPPGNPAEEDAQVNDFDLIAYATPNIPGQHYRGNYGLADSNWSVPTLGWSSRDPVNTVENIFVRDPAAGNWRIDVLAVVLAQDGRLETPAVNQVDFDADFALVVTVDFDCDGDGAMDSEEAGLPLIRNAQAQIIQPAIPDCNLNGIPDECEGGTIAPCRPEGEVPPDAFPKNRYISIKPSNPGEQTVIQVTALTLPASHSALVGDVWYAGIPDVYNENPTLGPMLYAARLGCDSGLGGFDAEVRDWGAEGLVNLTGAIIMPGATYEVRQCTAGGGLCSNPLIISTAKHGDVVEPSVTSQPNFVDISAVVDKYKATPGAVSKSRAQMQPNVPNPASNVNFLDISAVVAAFQGEPYPFPAAPCP